MSTTILYEPSPKSTAWLDHTLPPSVISPAPSPEPLRPHEFQQQRFSSTPMSSTVAPSESLDRHPGMSSVSRDGIRSYHVLQDWVELSTFHGILDLMRPPYGRVWKTTWIAVMLGFTAATVFSVEETVREYITNPTMQNYREDPSARFRYPDVIVCTHERVNSTALEEAGMSDGLIQLLKDRLNADGLAKLLTQRSDAFKRAIDDKNLRQNLSCEYEQFRRKHGNFEEILRQFGVRCEELVKYCSWNDGLPDVKCCDQATPIMDMTYGKCYRLRTGSQLQNTWNTQSYPGAGAGIQVGFGRPATCARAANPVRGVLVEFVHPDEVPSFSYHQVPSGVMASVQLSLQETHRINLGIRPLTCFESKNDTPTQEDMKNGRLRLDKFRQSANGCYYSVWSEAMNRSCGCTAWPGLVEIPLCEPFNRCQMEKMDEYNAETSNRQSKCLPQCTKRVFAASVSYSYFDARAFFDQLGEQRDTEEELTILDVYHPRMELLQVQEVEVYSIMTLISNIGGSIGLWLGASLMSILQMLFYFTKWLSLWKKGHN